MNATETPGPRRAVRALLFDPEGRVLLLRSHDWHADGDWWWELPGGGIEPGEGPVEALQRELREETGFTDVEIGPARWTWRGTWEFSDRRIDQEDVVHLCRLRSAVSRAPSPLPDEGVLAAEWVELSALREQQHGGRATVPPSLDVLVEQGWQEYTDGAAFSGPPAVVEVAVLPPV